jgi:hypothetical protein
MLEVDVTESRIIYVHFAYVPVEFGSVEILSCLSGELFTFVAKAV